MKKQELEEGLINLRLKQGLLLRKEWEDRKKFLAANLDDIPAKEKDFTTKLGLNDYFQNRTSLLDLYVAPMDEKKKDLQTARSQNTSSMPSLVVSEEQKQKHE